MSGTVAVILAGGRGERMGGVIKANLLVGDIPLLLRVAAVLDQADAVLLSHGPSLQPGLAPLPGQIRLADLDSPYGGPLAGLAAAVAWAAAQPEPPGQLILAAVDTPFLPPDYLQRLLAGLDPAPAVIATHAGQAYPTSSAWQFNAVATLPAAVRAGTAPHSLRRLAESLGAAEVAFPPYGGGDPFANANTPDDLSVLQRRARDA